MSNLLTAMADISAQSFDPRPDLQLGSNGKGDRPFLTFFTRCCRRPESLNRNIESVLRQTSGNWEQLFVVDQTGRHDEDPVLWANRQFERYAHLVKGQYVYPLDDDGMLVDNRMVEMLSIRAAEAVWADVLLVKMRSFNLDKVWRTHPGPDIWDINWENGDRPSFWVGTGFNIVTRTDVWKSRVYHYQHAPGGDHKFITSLIGDESVQFARCDIMASESAGRGCGVLREKCKSGWFEPFVAQLDLEPIDDNVWRLRA